MTIWEAVVLGVVQGLTEFLPVSSSGHLVVGQALLGVNPPGQSFEISLHVATLFSIVVVYRARLVGLVRDAGKGDPEAWRYLGLLVLATIPAAAVGLGLKDGIEHLFDVPVVAAVCFIFTGCVLWTAKAALARNPSGHPGVASALFMGFAQALALLPGVSRSGMTTITGLWRGVSTDEAAAFSFLMLIPAVLGALVLAIPDLAGGGGGVARGPLLAGSIAAAVTGILAIRIFVAMLRRRSFHWFAVYLWVVAAGFLSFLSLG